jgi:hypothetical protein
VSHFHLKIGINDDNGKVTFDGKRIVLTTPPLESVKQLMSASSITSLSHFRKGSIESTVFGGQFVGLYFSHKSIL